MTTTHTTADKRLVDLLPPTGFDTIGIVRVPRSLPDVIRVLDSFYVLTDNDPLGKGRHPRYRSVQVYAVPDRDR